MKQTKNKMEEKTFVRITNRDIYHEIQQLSNKLSAIEDHVIATNGKVKVNRWIATTALTLCLMLVAALIGGL